MGGKDGGTPKVRTVVVREQQDGWALQGLADTDVIVATATAALAIIRTHDAARARTAGVAVSVIEWCPTSRVGAIVVRVLTEQGS
jgi:hypothetical protein